MKTWFIKMGEIIDGKKISSEIHEKIASEVDRLKSKGIHPLLSTILVGDDPASELYVEMKSKACGKAGIQSKNFHLPEDVTEEELLDLIDKQNRDHSVHGILVQLPLPEHINQKKIFESISPVKDVDGLNPLSMGKLMLGDESLASCTPKGIIRMLEHEKIQLKGKEVVIVSHSVLIGKPLSVLFLNRDATVTVAHIHTRNLKEHTLRAEILVVAAGVPNLIKGDMVQKGVVVVDVGTNKVGGKLVGDVAYDEVKNKTSLITPVPGGVGPMTIAMLLENTVSAASTDNKGVL